MNFVILTDSCANLPDESIRRYDIRILSLSFLDNGKEYKSFENGKTLDVTEFYEHMREGAAITTSCVNIAEAEEGVEAILQEGKDILYLGFSSALSATYQNVSTAINNLREKYPERKMIAVDTLAAALGQGLLVALAARLGDEGKSIEEVAQYVEDNKLHLSHLFTVDSLKYLHRGGRVSTASAIVGTILDIKPVMHVDNEGRLVPLGKVRGVKAAMKDILKRLDDTIWPDANNPVYIVHADCYDRAKFIANYVRAKYGTQEIVIQPVDLVIGAHSGPGTLAVFFLADHR